MSATAEPVAALSSLRRRLSPNKPLFRRCCPSRAGYQIFPQTLSPDYLSDDTGFKHITFIIQVLQYHRRAAEGISSTELTSEAVAR